MMRVVFMIALIAAIVVSVTLPQPLASIQAAICGASLGAKLVMLFIDRDKASLAQGSLASEPPQAKKEAL